MAALINIPKCKWVCFGSKEDRSFNLDPWPFGEFYISTPVGEAPMQIYWVLMRANTDQDAINIIQDAYAGMNATIVIESIYDSPPPHVAPGRKI